MEKRIPFVLTVTMNCLEDTHIGNGIAKLGEYNSGQATDAGGKPWVPSDTFKGMVREGCRKVKEETHFFSDDAAYREKEVFCKELFEFSKGESLIIQPLRPSENAPIEMVVHDFTSVERGKSKDHALYSLQCVPQGTQFEGKIYGTVSKRTMIDFLKQGIQRIKEIGGSRNRGMGKVIFRVVEEKLVANPAHQKTSSSEPLFCLLKVKLEDSITIRDRGQANNLLFSRDHIRGDNLVGAWRHVLRTHLLCNGKDSTLLDLIDNPKIIFSNLYPYPENTLLQDLAVGSVIPTPLSLEIPKRSALKALHPPDSALESLKAQDKFAKEESLSDEEEQPKYKKAEAFLCQQGDHWAHLKPSQARRVRNKVTPETGNVEKDSLFVEDCLREDSHWFGWIRFEHVDDWQNFQNTFAPWLPDAAQNTIYPLGIGRGRKAMRIVETHLWTGRSQSSLQKIKVPSTPSKVTLTLLSDMILHDASGQSLTRLNADVLVEYVWGQSEQEGPPPSGELQQLRNIEQSGTHTAMHSNGGFYLTPQNLLCKGSAYQLEFRDPQSDAAQQIWKNLWKHSIQGAGLGENRHAGYGQFALDHPVHNVYTSYSSASNHKPSLEIDNIPRVQTNKEHWLKKAQEYFKDKDLTDYTIRLRDHGSQFNTLISFVETSTVDSIEAAIDNLKKRCEQKEDLCWGCVPKDDAPRTIDHVERFFKKLEKDPSSSEFKGDAPKALGLFLRNWLWQTKQ